jgi:hypothetical protein
LVAHEFGHWYKFGHCGGTDGGGDWGDPDTAGWSREQCSESRVLMTESPDAKTTRMTGSMCAALCQKLLDVTERLNAFRAAEKTFDWSQVCCDTGEGMKIMHRSICNQYNGRMSPPPGGMEGTGTCSTEEVLSPVEGAIDAGDEEECCQTDGGYGWWPLGECSEVGSVVDGALCVSEDTCCRVDGSYIVFPRSMCADPVEFSYCPNPK